MTFENPCKWNMGAWLVAVKTLSAYPLNRIISLDKCNCTNFAPRKRNGLNRGRDPFSQKFRNFRFRSKWNGNFRNVHLEKTGSLKWKKTVSFDIWKFRKFKPKFWYHCFGCQWAGVWVSTKHGRFTVRSLELVSVDKYSGESDRAE